MEYSVRAGPLAFLQEIKGLFSGRSDLRCAGRYTNHLRDAIQQDRWATQNASRF
jgi:hypothetical protein